MSGRFVFTARRALNGAMRRSARSAPLTSQSSQLSIRFTSALTLRAQAAVQQSPLGGGAIGSPIARALSTTATASSGSGCGSSACCGGGQCGSVSLVAGEDGEEPFIGAPSLSPHQITSSSVRGVAASPDDVKRNNAPINTPAVPSNTLPSPSSSSSFPSDPASPSAPSSPSPSLSPTAALSAAAAAASASRTPPPPPRTRCDPFEQGGHPLPTEQVLGLLPTLDAGWSYDAEKRILSRSFDFGREWGPNASAKALFSFVSTLGNIHDFGTHRLYNLNLNLRAHRVQVMLRTLQLQGISYADFALATQIDGLWFRTIQAKRAQEAKAQRQQPNNNAPHAA